MRTPYQGQIEVGSLSNGLYFVEVRNRAGARVGVTKFIISR
jgi:hypothetical protein